MAGFATGLIVGAGTAILGPVIVKPIVKEAIKLGLLAYEGSRDRLAGAGSTIRGIVEEAAAESQEGSARSNGRGRKASQAAASG